MKNFIFDVDGILINIYEMYMLVMIDVLVKYGYIYLLEEVECMKYDFFGIIGKDVLVIFQILEDQYEVILVDWFKFFYECEDWMMIFLGVEDMLVKLVNWLGMFLVVVIFKLGVEY